MHDSIIFLLHLVYIVHSYLDMDGCTVINFVKHVKIVFVQVGVVCMRVMMAFAGAITTKQQFMHPHCIVYYDKPKTWTKTVLDMLYKMIAEQPSLTQYGRPLYHYERKIIMLSSTDNNFMIFLLNF